jgi:hypothetical protein
VVSLSVQERAGIGVPPNMTFDRPTSVVVYGSSRPLLNWVAYALASAADSGFVWTDVRLQGEVLADADPLARNLVPPDRLYVVHPYELMPNDAAANMAVGGIVRGGEPPDTLGRLVEFLRLPLGAQRLLARGSSGNRPVVLVLSNAQRLVAVYPSERLAPVLGAIVGAGGSLLMTFADAPPASHRAFETRLYLEGDDPKLWKGAVLRVEKGPATGPLRAGSEYRLGDLDLVAAVLTRDFK